MSYGHSIQDMTHMTVEEMLVETKKRVDNVSTCVHRLRNHEDSISHHAWQSEIDPLVENNRNMELAIRDLFRAVRRLPDLDNPPTQQDPPTQQGPTNPDPADLSKGWTPPAEGEGEE